MLKSFENLTIIINKLRGKNGCPWDKKQTLKSIRANIIEEAYETVDAINRNNYQKLKEEAGDLLLQAVFISQLAKEKKYFTIKDVLDTLNQKLINRHPHIFGNTQVKNTEELLYHWERIKKNEKNNKKYRSILDNIPDIFPALHKAQKVQGKVERFGFKWQDLQAPLKKLQEEMKEFIAEAKKNNQKKMEEEMGDIFFTLINISRYFKVDPESALNKTTSKFIKRFQKIERKIGQMPSFPSVNRMISLWEKAKKRSVK